MTLVSLLLLCRISQCLGLHPCFLEDMACISIEEVTHYNRLIDYKQPIAIDSIVGQGKGITCQV